jgi:hypothetical protein
MKPAMTPPWIAGNKGLPMLSLLAGSEQQVIADSRAFDADQPGVGNQLQQGA